MTLYGKGNWTRFAVDPDLWANWVNLLNDPRKMFEASAFAARSVLLASDMESTCGINPPCWPCGDSPYPRDQIDLDRKVHPWIARALEDESNLTPWDVPEKVQEELGIALEGDRYWGTSPHHFQLLNDNENVIGFWMVLLKREILDDMNALKEHSAAIMWGSPLKRLPSSTRTDITKSLTEANDLTVYVSRCQCPVILDFNQGSIWVGTTSKKLVDAFRFWMTHFMQTPVAPMSLVLGGNHGWPALALQAFRDGDVFKLERQEALEALMNEKEDTEGEEVEEIPLEEGEPPKERYCLDNLAVYSKDNVRSCTVGQDAFVMPLHQRHGSVATKGAAEALTILNVVEGSTVGAAKVTFQDVIGEDFVQASVELNSNLVGGVYKGLELTFSSKVEEAFLNQQFPAGIFPESESGLAPKANRHWFAYYLWLLWAEQLVINVCCDALDLDPTLVAMRIKDQEQATPAEEAVIRSAVTSTEVDV